MRAVSVQATALAVAAGLSMACADAPTRPTPAAPDAQPSFVRSTDKLKDWLRGYLTGPGASSVAMLVGAGDIAECYQGSVPPPFNPTVDVQGSAARRTARLLDRIPGTVIAVGDNAYQFGSPIDYETCYDPTWGRHFDRTRPATGNHEYMTPGAAGFFAYFRERSGLPLPGYYSYDQGSWHVIVLNSTPQVYACYPLELTEVQRDPSWNPPGNPPLSAMPTSADAGRLCAGDAAQQAWLASDLTMNASRLCAAVYWHHPRFSSGFHGNHYQMQRVWDTLYKYGVDVVVTGHDHNYERFAPQDRDGQLDPVYGIRQFVVGTGGADLRPVGPPIPNSEVIIAGAYGVIALALNDGSYGWAFVDVDRSVRDSGTGGCHGPPPT
jgi:calcineurin-like phosphoesterase family protein